MQHNYHAYFQNIRIRPLEKSDIEILRIWRNDTSKTKYLRPIGKITPQMQEKWYETYLRNPDEIAFAIDETENLNRMVGSLFLYNFKEKIAEIGKIQVGDDEAHGMGIGGKSFVLAMKIGFERMNLEKIIASVHRENIAAYKSYMKIGFEIVGSHPALIGGIEDEIEMDIKRFQEINKYIPQILLS